MYQFQVVFRELTCAECIIQIIKYATTSRTLFSGFLKSISKLDPGEIKPRISPIKAVIPGNKTIIPL